MAGSLKHQRVHRTFVYPSWRAIIPGTFVASLFAVLAKLCCEFFGVRTLSIPLDLGLVQLALPLSVPLLVFLVGIARPLAWLFDSVYVIGRHHVYALKGRTSLNRRRIEIPYEDMRGVRTYQNIIDRLLGIGTVQVWTAAIEPAAISLRGIADPDRVNNELRKRMDHARLKRPFAAPGQELEIQHRSAA